MKYIILLGDGMADRPCADLGGRTCLQAARTPNLDQLATLGQVGMVHTVPAGFPPGSDVANLTVLGYDPRKYYTGRSPLEAASIGVALGPDDVAYRCNLVTLKITGSAAPGSRRRKAVMEDFSAGHISTEEARMFCETIMERPPPALESLVLSTGSRAARKILVVLPTTLSMSEYDPSGTLSLGKFTTRSWACSSLVP